MGGGDSTGGFRKRRQPSRLQAARYSRPAACTAAALGLVLALWLLGGRQLLGLSASGDSCNLRSVFKLPPVVSTVVPAALPGVLTYLGPPPEHPDRYTLLLNSFKRPDLLRRSVAHYSRCEQADAIRVIWSEWQVQPPPSERLNGTEIRRGGAAASGQEGKHERRASVPVVYDVQANASLNNRFRPLPGLRTAAVLSLDDDVMVPCAEVGAAFAAWRRRPVVMAGWFPRGVAPRGGHHCRVFDYLSRDQSVLLRGSYSMLLSKGAFLHRDYLQQYTAGMAPGVHAYVDAHHNCEDIAMAFLVASLTGAPPEYVRAPSLRDLGQGLFKVKGISSIGGHAAERTACVNEFTRLFGRMPLVQRPLSSHPQPLKLRFSTLADRSLG